MSDHYARLGVPPSASPEEIKRAWRDRAFQLHPDRNPGDDGASFRAVAEAYEVLSDPDRRRSYDQGRAASPEGGRPEGASAPSGWRDPSGMWRDPAARWREEWRDHGARAFQEAFVRHQQAQQEARLRELRQRAYEAEQARLEAEMGHHLGDWTRYGVMRDGSLGRRR